MPGNEKIEKGRIGEETAVLFLESENFTILERNFRIRFGELDIIARKEHVVYGIEVKFRKVLDNEFHPIQVMTHRKLNRMKKVMETYVNMNSHLSSLQISFCLIGIDEKGKVDFYSDLSK